MASENLEDASAQKAIGAPAPGSAAGLGKGAVSTGIRLGLWTGLILAVFFAIVVLFRTGDVRVVRVDSGKDLVAHLKRLDLWDVRPGSEIPPVVFQGFPEDFDALSLPTRKKAFLHTLLPAAMIALAEVKQERETLLPLLEKLGDCRLDLVVAGEQDGERCGLAGDEIRFLRQLSRKYQTAKAAELATRVNAVPVSLVLAQGALESSWGTSRFVSEGNNVFGVWTWGEEGLVPARRDEGKSHKVAVYDSILESVRSYVLMLNRVAAYRELREIRRKTMDPFSLARGLLFYSEKREEYIMNVRQVIEANNLTKYDRYLLAS